MQRCVVGAAAAVSEPVSRRGDDPAAVRAGSVGYRAAWARSPGSPRNSSASARCPVPSNQTPLRSPRQKLTPPNRPATATFCTSQPTDAAKRGSRSARYDQELTSSGIKLLLGVKPSAVVTSKPAYHADHFAWVERLGQIHAGTDISLLRRVGRLVVGGYQHDLYVRGFRAFPQPERSFPAVRAQPIAARMCQAASLTCPT